MAGAQASAPELAFARGGTVYVARTDGTGVRPLTRGSAVDWSPDGRRIVFARRDVIYVSAADGTGERRLARGFGPRWSPDGRWIAFTAREGVFFSVQLMRPDGSRRHRLIRGASPAWSPNGRLIAFSSDRETPENPEIYVVRPDGSGLKRLTHTAGGVEVLGDDGFPDWSPDGKRIVFTSNRTGEGDLWTMRADGSGERRLAGLPRRDDFSPRFSPDGGWIAFESHTLGRADVYLVRADGTGAKRLAVRASAPSWKPE
jgi:Tol biopolymer transport system component